MTLKAVAPQREEAVVALAALAEVAAGGRASASCGRAGERVAWGWGAG